MEKKNVHKDHRQRVRARYFKEGIGSMADHNIIEFLLFYGIPFKDTNNVAHGLIEKFGDLNGVLEAPKEELMKVNGVGENVAALIRLTHDISLLYNERKQQRILDDTEKAFIPYIEAKYSGERREIVYLLCLDANGKLQRCIKVCDGSPDTAVVDTRAIVETVVRFDSKNVVLAHNHPNGFAVPSLADVKTTEELIPVLDAIGVNLVDHIIVSADDTFSMAQSNKYGYLFN